MSSDVCVTLGGYLFNYRVAAIVIEDGRALTCRFDGEDWCFLPGGRVTAGETSLQAIRRELREELGDGGEVMRPVFFIENFFGLDGRNFHEISAYFLVNLPATVKREAHTVREVGRELHFEWVPLKDLAARNLQPAPLSERLQHLPAHPEHLVLHAR